VTCRWCHRSLLLAAERRAGVCVVCRPETVVAHAQPVEGPAGDPEHGGSPAVPAPPPATPTEPAPPGYPEEES